MKLLRKIVIIIIVFILGFWSATANLLHGTQAGDIMDTIMELMPNRQEVEEFIDLPSEAAVTEEQYPGEETKEYQHEINAELIEAKIIELTNQLRQEKNLPTLEVHPELTKVANIRAKETEELFSHTRPDGTDAFTVFREEGVNYPYQTAGENLAMGTHYLSDEGMAELLFEGWVESQGHYENMINPNFREIGVGVHFDGEMLYLTQIFGTRR